jgi:hypothetical protein
MVSLRKLAPDGVPVLAVRTQVRGDIVSEHGFLESDDLQSQKREALTRLSVLWSDALGDGIEPDVLVHAALFAALGDLVTTYGETAVAEFAGRLPARIAAGEFSLAGIRH